MPSRDRFEERHRLCANRFARTNRAQSFHRLRLHAHPVEIDAEQLGYARAHLGDERRKPRALGEDGDIDVADAVPGRRRSLDDLREQSGAVRAAITWFRIGEVLADVAQRQRPEHGVDEGVQNRITVGMAEETPFKRHRNAAKAQRPPLDQPMNVPTLPDPSHPRHLRQNGGAEASAVPVMMATRTRAPARSSPVPGWAMIRASPDESERSAPELCVPVDRTR
jgi:hypothetical protein